MLSAQAARARRSMAGVGVAGELDEEVLGAGERGAAGGVRAETWRRALTWATVMSPAVRAAAVAGWAASQSASRPIRPRWSQ